MNRHPSAPRAPCLPLAACLPLLLALLLAPGVSEAQTTTGAQAATEAQPIRRTVSLDARLGLGLIDGRVFDVRSLYLDVEGFYFGVGFHEEASDRSYADKLTIQGLAIEGIRHKQLMQIPFTFGARVYGFNRAWADLRLDAYLKGGIELEFSRLVMDDGSRIPGNPENNMLLGVGTRAQFTHPIAYWLGENFYLIRNIYLGVGTELDVVSRRLQIEADSDDNFISFAGYFILGSTKMF